VLQGYFAARPEHVAALRQVYCRSVYVDDFGDPVTEGWRKQLFAYISKKLALSEEERHGCSNSNWVLADEAAMILARLWAAEPIRAVSTNSGAVFEIQCEQLARDAGFQIARRGGPGDQGADLVIASGTTRIVVQCKYRAASDTLGNAAVQEVAAARSYYDASHAMVVSNVGYTPSARRLAHKIGVLLTDPERLVAQLRGLSPQI
jgi:restriction system protein